MRMNHGWASAASAPRVTIWLCVLLSIAACAGADGGRRTDTAGPEVMAIDPPAVVASVGPSRSGAAMPADAPSICPTHVRDLHTGFDFVQAESHVVREAARPGTPPETTRADAVYIRTNYRIGDPHANDTLHVDCRSMRHLRTSRSRA